jgi:hypothetical protein
MSADPAYSRHTDGKWLGRTRDGGVVVKHLFPGQPEATQTYFVNLNGGVRKVNARGAWITLTQDTEERRSVIFFANRLNH